MATKTNKTETTFTRDKETKRTFRYVQQEEVARIQGAIYLSKEETGENPPATITVTVTF